MPAKNGFVPTPAALADYAAGLVFGVTRPDQRPDGGRLLLPGLGSGNLYDAVGRYCTAGENLFHPSFDYPMPECVGIESDPDRAREFHDEHPDDDRIDVLEADFLTDPPAGRFDWVLANPPYTRYKNINETKRERYAEEFELASGQFPLHVPFYEHSMRLLKNGGELVFILPFSVFTANSLEPFRQSLRGCRLGPILDVPEQAFDRSVRTVLVGLTKTRAAGYSWLWLEPFYGYNLVPMLEAFGAEDVEAAAAAYIESYESYRQTVRTGETTQGWRPDGVETDRDTVRPSRHQLGRAGGAT